MVKINQYSCRQIPSCSPFTCSLQVNSRTVCRQFAGKRTITADPAEKGALLDINNKKGKQYKYKLYRIYINIKFQFNFLLSGPKYGLVLKVKALRVRAIHFRKSHLIITF
ncbi:Hypothetical_protein [Hexamita inflata]|uniref:Hypothetical_protein n=1 Tax=Hexamita inflata TaxID=28002 RepID=A0AA86QPR8_9EUKA|nr:Hypothetical protein HINF_LOCUS49985 [Hexamita inflata]